LDAVAVNLPPRAVCSGQQIVYPGSAGNENTDAYSAISSLINGSSRTRFETSDDDIVANSRLCGLAVPRPGTPKRTPRHTDRHHPNGMKDCRRPGTLAIVWAQNVGAMAFTAAIAAGIVGRGRGI
jgi:hypothetical protein